MGYEGEGAVQQEDAFPWPVTTALVIIMIISNHRIILNHY